ncbi:hypothetical protein BgAZ_500440 [Babesia gibsoni]|uniref:Uncharacterized protein n=1 Tax=Babesia gibsoni TaxID=33632 RepID=A0AAD8LHK8_BABGI|nr:hypothetical protein BgAZ_500440 [Babesia gibsoni]
MAPLTQPVLGGIPQTDGLELTGASYWDSLSSLSWCKFADNLVEYVEMLKDTSFANTRFGSFIVEKCDSACNSFHCWACETENVDSLLRDFEAQMQHLNTGEFRKHVDGNVEELRQLKRVLGDAEETIVRGANRIHRKSVADAAAAEAAAAAAVSRQATNNKPATDAKPSTNTRQATNVRQAANTRQSFTAADRHDDYQPLRPSPETPDHEDDDDKVQFVF